MAELYDNIGSGYDTTRKADPGILLESASLLGIREGGKYLDIACGTGNYTVGLSQIGGAWFACDSSERMLSKARKKSTSVLWSLCDVENLSYPSEYFDGVYCSLAIHHFPNLGASFKEVQRVLKPGASFILFTALPGQMENYWLNHYFPQMMQKACRQMPSLEDIRLALEGASLALVSSKLFNVSLDLQDLFLYSGKQRPELYLSDTVRSGISSFHGMCPAEELTSALARLKADIDSQHIQKVMRDYDNDVGDYIFINARRNR